jgi:hypothetical protein
MPDDEYLKKAYEENVGRPPVNRFEDDPDWLYRGTKKEREELKRSLGLLDDEESTVLLEGQEELPL